MVLEGLRRPPCLVSFSGGLDSSALLALAATVARRHGLPDPIPATLVFAGSDAADETHYQELVLDHLGLTGWRRFEIADQLDAVGPVAQEVLLRHGLVWPFNLHFHLPIVKAAVGGSVITGFGGDELGRSSSSLSAEWRIAQRRVFRPADVALIAYRLSPPGVKWMRELARRNSFASDLPWLTEHGRRRLRRAVASENTLPFGWGPLLRRWLWRARYFQVCRENFRIMGDAFGVRMIHPFVEAPVLQSLPAEGRFAGLGGRRGVLDFLMGDLVPRALLERTTKASFSDPLWTETALEFAAGWSGHGLDERLVDPEVVRRTWLSPGRTVMATTMLQAAWLVDHAATAPAP